MKRWLETHNEDEYPDLSITQENDAFHVLPEIRHPPEESIKSMCSPGFFSQHKYKYVEGPMDFGLKESFGEFGNPPASSPYEEPVHSEACVAKVAPSDEDLVSGYARAVNGSMRSRDTKNETLNPVYKKPTTASGIEHPNLDYAEQNTNTNETHRNTKETEIGEHPGISCNKSGADKAAIGFKETNNKRPRKVVPFLNSKIVAPVQKAASNDSVDDHNYDIHVSSGEDKNNIYREGYENKRHPCFSIYHEKQTDIPMETKYQCPKENRGNQVVMKEKDETQRYKSETELQEQKRDEEDNCGPIAPSADLKHNENAILEEVNEAKKNSLVEHSVNTKYPSLTIHYKKPTGIPKEKGYRLATEHGRNQADLTEKDETRSDQSSKTNLHDEQEGKEEGIYDFVVPSSDLVHNENAINDELHKQERKAVKNGGSVDTKYPSLTIHYKEPTGVPKETENQRPREHRKYQAGMTGRDETQGTPPKKRTKLQPGHQDNEGDINDCIPMNPEGEEKNARLGEICNQKQNASQEENGRMTYSHKDDSDASTEDTSVTQTSCTGKIKEEDHATQTLQPTGEGTECEVDHQPSHFRRTTTIWRKRKNSETKKQATRKAKNMENKENATPENGSEKEVVR